MKSLNFFTAFLIRTAIGVIESNLISNINNEEVRRAMLLSLKPVRKTIDVLTDGIERNDEQVKEVWDGFVSNELPDFAEAELALLVQKIKDENARAVVGVLSDPVVDIFRLLTDADKDDKGQVKARLQELIADPKSLEVLIVNVAIPVAENIKDEKIRDFILAFLQSLLDGGIELKEGGTVSSRSRG